MRWPLLLMLLLWPTLIAAASTPSVDRVGDPFEPTELAKAVTVLGSWDFEDGMGGPDPQGWTTRDLGSLVHTHVDDFAGLTGYAPISGSQSLWCGRRDSGWSGGAGYGNRWLQTFTSEEFAVVGVVNLHYDIVVDLEALYEEVSVRYEDNFGNWILLQQYVTPTTTTENLVVPAANHDGTIRFQFMFRSDDGLSDEDLGIDTLGAFVLDDLSITDSTGIIDVQDFEAESQGATTTVDGDWTSGGANFGDYAGLVHGSTVVQEDIPTFNNTHFWSFFNGSPDDWTCGGFPGQLVVPQRRTDASHGEEVTIENEILSPLIAAPVTPFNSLELSFDVYWNNHILQAVFLAIRIYSYVGGVESYKDYPLIFLADTDSWSSFSRDVWDYLDPAATNLRLGIRVLEIPFYGPGNCHTQAPLIDNVQICVDATIPNLVVTNADPSGLGSFSNAWETAAAIATPHLITFNIPGAGPHVITPGVLSSQSSPVVVDGRTQPGWAGTPLIEIRSELAFGPSTGFNRDYEVYGISFADALDPAMEFVGAGQVVVESCQFGEALTGSPAWLLGGIVLSDVKTANIGGLGMDEGNVFGSIQGIPVEATATPGLESQSGPIVVRGNSFYDNAQPLELGMGANDDDDLDTGINTALNHPVLTGRVAGVVSGSLESTPNTTFTLDFYSNYACHGSGVGEGRTYLESHQVTTDAAGLVNFAIALAKPAVSLGLTAMTVDAAGNCSEFGTCLAPEIVDPLLVTNTNDGGPGSLRDAIQAASVNDIVRFDIPGPGPHVIMPGSPLPPLSSGVTVDGLSQPGSTANTQPYHRPGDSDLQVVLDGTNAGVGNGLEMTGSDATVRGLAIHSFSGAGIEVSGAAQAVESCVIGSDPSRTAVLGNCIGIRVVAAQDTNYIGAREETPDDPSKRVFIAESRITNLRVDDSDSGVLLDHVFITDLAGPPTSTLECGLIEGFVSGIHHEAEDYVQVQRTRIEHQPGYAMSTHDNNADLNWFDVSLFNNQTAVPSLPSVDMFADGVDINDPLDADGKRQNHPVVTNAVGVNVVEGLLHSTPNQLHTIHVYASAGCHSSGYGEGNRYLGSFTGTTDTSGDLTFSETLPGSFLGGESLTAVAVGAQWIYSEFGPCHAVSNTPAGSSVVISPLDVTSGGQPASITYQTVTTAGNTWVNSSATGPTPDPGMYLGQPPLYYDITTDASYAGPITIQIQYDESLYGGLESELTLMHYDLGAWQDITTSIDTANNMITGVATSLSPFAVSGVDPLTSVPEHLPTRWELSQAAPNPFNPRTTIRFSLPADAPVSLDIFDLAGRRVRRLVSGTRLPAGFHRVSWDGLNDQGRSVASGVYIYRIRARDFEATRKMTLLK